VGGTDENGRTVGCLHHIS